MLEHVHLAVRARRPDYDVSTFLYDVKRPVSWKAKRRLQQTGNSEWLRRLSVRHGKRKVFRFWQPGGGYDKNVWQQRPLLEILDYIRANPIRRGWWTPLPSGCGPVHVTGQEWTKCSWKWTRSQTDQRTAGQDRPWHMESTKD